MQDRYAGDIGDYIKLALLRKLAQGEKLGIAWYRTPDSSNNDGRHIGYLDDACADKWRGFDPQLYDRLKLLVQTGRRSVGALEELMDGDVSYHSDLLPCGSERTAWFEGLRNAFGDRDLVFVDPDNGVEPASFNSNHRKSIKSVMLGEIRDLHFPGRPVVIYHHHTRFTGGHLAEIQHVGALLKRPRPWESHMQRRGFTSSMSSRRRALIARHNSVGC